LYEVSFFPISSLTFVVCVLDGYLMFILGPVWILILLFMLPSYLFWDARYATTPSFLLVEMGVSQIFLPVSILSLDPPNLCLPNS
jgi:hypothetical protein